MAKSYNIVAMELLKLYNNGYGLHQGMREIGISKGELCICLERNEKLAEFVKTRFKLTADQIREEAEESAADKSDLDIAELRDKAKKLGIKNVAQMGAEKLLKRIQEAEENAAAAEKDNEQTPETTMPAPTPTDETPAADKGDQDASAPAADEGSQPDGGNAEGADGAPAADAVNE